MARLASRRAPGRSIVLLSSIPDCLDQLMSGGLNVGDATRRKVQAQVRPAGASNSATFSNFCLASKKFDVPIAKHYVVLLHFAGFAEEA